MPLKRRRKLNGGLYYHYSVSRVLPMNMQSRPKNRDDGSKEGIVIKPSNIRIWIHDKDIAKLTKVIWEGQGNRLRTEVCSNNKVKKFLDAVPYIMNAIKDIHTAVIGKDIDGLIAKLAPPVPPVILSSKDSNGLTPLHKAAGLAHTRIVEYLLNTWPDAANEPDSTGKTPLHWAASAKNNTAAYDLLLNAGADEQILDYKMRTPPYYKTKPNDIERSLLTIVPEAPRVPQPGFPPGYDWSLLNEDSYSHPIVVPNNKFIKKSESNYDNYSSMNKIGNSSVNRYGSLEVVRNEEDLFSKTKYPSQSYLNTESIEPITVSDDSKEKSITNGNELHNEVEKLVSESEVAPEVSLDDNFNDLLEKNVRDMDEKSTELEDDETEIPTDENKLENEIHYINEKEEVFDEGKVSIDKSLDNPEVSDTDNLSSELTINDNNELEKDKLENTENELNSYNLIQDYSVKETNDTDDSVLENRIEIIKDEDYSGDVEDDINENTNKANDDNDTGNEENNNGASNESTGDYLDGTSNRSPRMNDDISKDEDEDSNSNIKQDADDSEVSPSPALEIEGIVRGEPENVELQSQGTLLQANDEYDTNIQTIIESGDMEHLAGLVLNGEGRKLIGLTSKHQEIQAFLDNVPAYMSKIRRVHLSAREGSLRDLQSALDRRKFAIAKDDISPNGATPLHVATIFGHAGIIRYLAGRFPETTTAIDFNGRTALHYAATIHDNGHFYNLLSHLGANPKAEDNLGHSAEYYTNHEQSDVDLSHKQLLRDFGAQEELATEMLNDQEYTNRNNQVEIPLFRTEEGRYLATTLGDPLIKGLTEVANNRPTDPVAFLANYLHGFSKQKTMNDNETESITNADGAQENPIPQSTLPQQSTTDNLDEPPPTSDGPESAATGDERDEHGQSMLHFACARSHSRNSLMQLIEESGVSVTFRDELYRTARDVSLQAGQPENAKEIDKYVLSLAARGEMDIIELMVLEGYDHITDIKDNEDLSIIEVTGSRGHTELVEFLESIEEFEANREKLHRAIRLKNLNLVRECLSNSDGNQLARAKNYYGRCAIHIAVLKEHEEIVEYLATTFRQTLRIGDNLERTPLHYAMGVGSVEALSRILVKNGSKRVIKDLKGRQPSYYFINKSDILRLQEEEEDEEEP